MRILVTGAAGFIGSTIVELLRDRGHEVVAVDLLLDRAHASRPAWVGDDLHVVDVRDEAALTGLLRGVDAVCHQAAMVGLGLTIHDAPDYASHNVVGTASLVSAMARAEVAWLVQASSMVVYGGGREVCPVHGDVATRPRTTEDLAAGCFEPRCAVCGQPVSWGLVGEDAPLKPQNAYAATKLAQEHLAIAWAEQSGGRAISLRYHNVYGPRMPRDTPYAGVASIFRSALAAGRAPQVYEDGRQMRDFVHVRDVARANLAALEGLAPRPGRHRGTAPTTSLRGGRAPCSTWPPPWPGNWTGPEPAGRRWRAARRCPPRRRRPRTDQDRTGFRRPGRIRRRDRRVRRRPDAQLTGGSRRSDGLGGEFHRGQAHREAAALRDVVDGHRAVLRSNEPLHDGQAEPGSRAERGGLG